MDSFSVSIAHGLSTKTFKAKNATKIATFFGFFQAFMPLLGWYAGVYVLDLIAEFDHWVAFFLLTFIGSRMIYESVKDGTDKLASSLSIKILLILSIATSIDALAVGLGLAAANVSIWDLVIVTGIVTFGLSFSGVYIGRKFGCLLKNRVEAVGGIILIGIGLKMLLEHLGFI